MATAEIPVTVSEDAAAFIAELGMQREFEQMIEHTRQTIPDLRMIDVVLDPDPSGEIGPGIIIQPHRPDPGPGPDPAEREWGVWLTNAFPPQVWTNFVLMSLYEPQNRGR